jgi:hypothetical protein
MWNMKSFLIPVTTGANGTVTKGLQKYLETIPGKRSIDTVQKEQMSRDSSVGIALGYGLDNRGSRVRFPAGVGNFSLHHRVQNVSGAHLASYPMGTRGSFPGSKAAGT